MTEIKRRVRYLPADEIDLFFAQTIYRIGENRFLIGQRAFVLEGKTCSDCAVQVSSDRKPLPVSTTADSQGAFEVNLQLEDEREAFRVSITSPAGIQKEETIIRPPSKITFLNLRELYEFRHMLWGMVRRDIKIKYSELSLGIFWAVARPLIMLLVFILIKRFSHANMYVTITYSVYVYSGLILWFYF